MTEILIVLNLLVVIRAAIAWFADATTAEELERAAFRASSWPSRERP